MDNYKIIFSSGGTGGHIFPTLSAIKYFCKKKYNVVLVTDPRGNKYLEDYKEFKSYILNTDTLFKKKIFKAINIFS